MQASRRKAMFPFMGLVQHEHSHESHIRSALAAKHIPAGAFGYDKARRSDCISLCYMLM